MKYDNIGKMPDTRTGKWSDMKAGRSHLSDEWHEMEACEPKFSEKWDDQSPSKARMSERYVEMNPSAPHMSEQFVDMKQEGREDPYTMHPSAGDREGHFKPMAKEKADGGKVERSKQHTESGSFREI